MKRTRKNSKNSDEIRRESEKFRKNPRQHEKILDPKKYENRSNSERIGANSEKIRGNPKECERIRKKSEVG